MLTWQEAKTYILSKKYSSSFRFPRPGIVSFKDSNNVTTVKISNSFMEVKKRSARKWTKCSPDVAIFDSLVHNSEMPYYARWYDYLRQSFHLPYDSIVEEKSLDYVNVWFKSKQVDYLFRMYDYSIVLKIYFKYHNSYECISTNNCYGDMHFLDFYRGLNWHNLLSVVSSNSCFDPFSNCLYEVVNV